MDFEACFFLFLFRVKYAALQAVISCIGGVVCRRPEGVKYRAFMMILVGCRASTHSNNIPDPAIEVPVSVRRVLLLTGPCIDGQYGNGSARCEPSCSSQ